MIALVALLLSTGSAPPSSIADVLATYPDCQNPKADDLRPFTLCLAETDLERAEMDMQRVWTLALARVRARKGLTGEREIQSEQRKWVVRRDRKCVAEAEGTPVTQIARNELSCRAALNTERMEYLKAVARLK